MKQEYEVITEGWLDGVWRNKGDTLTLHPPAAEALVIAGSIRLKRQMAKATVGKPVEKAKA